MKKRFGGVLAMALGTVLIFNGLSQSGDGAVGRVGSQCGAGQVGVLQSNQCPVGGIIITDNSPAAPGLPADFDVTITSTNCLGTDGQPVNRTITVPTVGSVGTPTSGLYVFTNFGSVENGPKCQYTLTRETNPDFTATFTPASPVTIPFNNQGDVERVARVTLVNQAVAAPTTSAAPSTSTAPSSSSSASASASAAPTEDSQSASAAPASDSNAAAPIAETGPSQPVKASLWLGIGLLLLGLFLCFEGRVRSLARHRN